VFGTKGLTSVIVLVKESWATMIVEEEAGIREEVLAATVAFLVK
jgi:hypothetical protein